MSLYALGDLHLSLGAAKPMDIFGGAWSGYMEKLETALAALGGDDTLVVPGDVSWAMRMPDALPDFQFLERCPANIILAKGNHDYWWTTCAKMEAFFAQNGLKSLRILHNNAYRFGDAAVCGTRGWFYEEERGGAQDEKVLSRELGRLRASLEAGRKLGATELLCFLHYPPLYEGYRCDRIVEILEQYGVRRCFYGHLHGHALRRAIVGEYRGIEYTAVSADAVNFQPVKIL
jgi:predicted phosphohydrolase